jgi:diguanylate cyclase (GGDEF)-like protein
MDAANPSGYKRSFGSLGNEEYIVILPQTGLHGAERCAVRICEAIRKKPFDDAYKQTVSGGVAEYKRGETIPELLARADEALRNAKASGGNQVFCSQPKKPRRAEILRLRNLPS